MISVYRFVPTPVEADYTVSGAVVRVQTNCQAVADQLSGALASAAAGGAEVPRFICKVVTDSDTGVDPAVESLGMDRMAHNGLAFIRMGHETFIAADRDSQEAIAFIPESLVRDARFFRDFFVPALISLFDEFDEAAL